MLPAAVVALLSRPSERRYAAERRYRTSGRGPGWASAFCVISISNSVLTSDRRASPSGPSFSGVLPERKRRRRKRKRTRRHRWEPTRSAFNRTKYLNSHFSDRNVYLSLFLLLFLTIYFTIKQ